jgi:coiled-coil domain-containing protein 130
MSSLAASRADNFYFPPEWRPEYGGISKFQGSKGANQYQKYGIVRFELPFDGWCLGCERHMSKGLRFNAKKDKAGNYHSTTIFAFSMKCYSCDQKFLIKTNPQERTYDFVEGLRKHIQDYEPDKNDGVIEILSDEQKQVIATDPMARLQHTREDERRTQTALEQLTTLQSLQENIAKPDYQMNSVLRKQNRLMKKHENEQKEAGREKGLNFRLLDEPFTKEDYEDIKLFNLEKEYRDDSKEQRNALISTREKLNSQSIFNSKKEQEDIIQKRTKTDNEDEEKNRRRKEKRKHRVESHREKITNNGDSQKKKIKVLDLGSLTKEKLSPSVTTTASATNFLLPSQNSFIKKKT